MTVRRAPPEAVPLCTQSQGTVLEAPCLLPHAHLCGLNLLSLPDTGLPRRLQERSHAHSLHAAELSRGFRSCEGLSGGPQKMCPR